MTLDARGVRGGGGRIGGEPGALLADGTVWYAALYDGRIVRSQDGGQTWHDVYQPPAQDE